MFAGLTVDENLKIAERNGSARYDPVYELFPELRERAQAARRDAVRRAAADGRARQGAAERTRVLLVDEPTKGLAPKLVAEVGDVLARVSRAETCCWSSRTSPLVERIAGGGS